MFPEISRKFLEHQRWVLERAREVRRLFRIVEFSRKVLRRVYSPLQAVLLRRVTVFLTTVEKTKFVGFNQKQDRLKRLIAAVPQLSDD